jgi:hypothetical protein
MLSRGTGWPHFAQISPAFTARFAGFSPPMPNNFSNQATAPPL